MPTKDENSVPFHAIAELELADETVSALARLNIRTVESFLGRTLHPETAENLRAYLGLDADAMNKAVQRAESLVGKPASQKRAGGGALVSESQGAATGSVESDGWPSHAQEKKIFDALACANKIMHAPETCRQYAGQWVAIRGGAVVAHGTLADVTKEPAEKDGEYTVIDLVAGDDDGYVDFLEFE